MKFTRTHDHAPKAMTPPSRRLQRGAAPTSKDNTSCRPCRTARGALIESWLGPWLNITRTARRGGERLRVPGSIRLRSTVQIPLSLYRLGMAERKFLFRPKTPDGRDRGRDAIISTIEKRSHQLTTRTRRYNICFKKPAKAV